MSKITRSGVIRILGNNSRLSVKELIGMLGEDASNSSIKNRAAVVMSNLKRLGSVRSERMDGINQYSLTPKGVEQFEQLPVEPINTKPPEEREPEAAPADTATALPATSVDLMPAINLIADSVARILGEAIGPAIQRVVDQQVQAAIDYASTQISHISRSVQPTKASTDVVTETDAPRVTVVGLLPAQVELIKSEFGKELHLSFVSSQKSDFDRLRNLCKTSKYVVSMTSFLSHAIDNVIKSSGVEHKRINGGMSLLRDHLTAIYLNNQPTPIQ